MKKLLIISTLLITPAFAHADVIQERLDTYKAEGASNFSAEAGKKMWTQVIPFEKKGELFKDRSCATCHNADPTTPGKHAKTGKVISPMTLGAISVNRKGEEEVRYSTVKKVEKWFKRNCKWTYGRVCTPQEKGDFLMYFKSL
ncbi:MAG: hypothetical protein COB79_00590 [Zetaproteobacteria bacterium]|nr:MAG: hypothetical protein COB79_00590 [Zetaproteobacteria bacterium]